VLGKKAGRRREGEWEMRGEERVFVEECKVVMCRLWCLCVFE